jgi:hypothetical protein
VFVGANRMSKRAKLEKFHMVPGSERLYRVDQAANELRKVSRRRWWGKLFVIIGVTLAIGVAGIAPKFPAQAAGCGVVSLLLGGVGLAMLRSYQGWIPFDDPNGVEAFQVLSPVRMHAHGVHDLPLAAPAFPIAARLGSNHGQRGTRAERQGDPPAPATTGDMRGY